MKESDITICDWLKNKQKFTLSEFKAHVKDCNRCKMICCAIGKFCDDNIDKRYNDDIDECHGGNIENNKE